MASITTRVRLPDEYEWPKIQIVLQYIGSTIHITLILIVDKLNLVEWWVEKSY